jgi:hypothetical protein
MLRLILLLLALPLLAMASLRVVSAVEQPAPPSRPNVVVWEPSRVGPITATGAVIVRFVWGSRTLARFRHAARQQPT